MYGDAGNDLIHWDYADLVLGTVDGGTGTDILEIVGQKGVDDFYVTSLGGSSSRSPTSRPAPRQVRSPERIIEDLRLDARAGADTITSTTWRTRAWPSSR
jgi:Ca2+-binding RTX toxin-like protein